MNKYLKSCRTQQVSGPGCSRTEALSPWGEELSLDLWQRGSPPVCWVVVFFPRARTDGLTASQKDRKWMGVLTLGPATHLASEDSRRGPVNPTALFPNSLGYSFLLPVKGAQRLERVVCSQGDRPFRHFRSTQDSQGEGRWASRQELSCSRVLQGHVLGSCCRGSGAWSHCLVPGALMGQDHVFLSHHCAPVQSWGFLKTKPH